MNQSIRNARSQQLARSEYQARRKAKASSPKDSPEIQVDRDLAYDDAPSGFRVSFMGFLVFALLVSNTVFATGFFLQTEIEMLFGMREQQVVRAYEDRVTGLRMQVDRLRSSQVANRGNMNLQMQELMRRQTELNQRQEYIRSLANRADGLGLTSLRTKPIKSSALDMSVPTASIQDNNEPFAANMIGPRIKSMSNQASVALAMLENAAVEDRDLIRTNLRALGLSLPSHHPADAVGGPYIAADEFGAPDEEFLASANRVNVSLEALEHAKGFLLTAPLLQPIRGKIKVSSKFGTRRDPFHGRRAFHSGIDFKSKTGTPVRATGAGKVIFAGRRGGYGNSIEIRHTNGITTRYGHLSKIFVHNGATVEAGQNIGAVGATGRATGPHLHYEVRNDDGEPSDPATFIRTGYKLRDYF